MPILLQLRNNNKNSKKTLQLWVMEYGEPDQQIEGPIILSEGEEESKILEVMNRHVLDENSEFYESIPKSRRQESGADTCGISSKRYLKIEIKGDLPSIDLLDLPGIVLATDDDEPDDLEEQVKKLIK